MAAPSPTAGVRRLGAGVLAVVGLLLAAGRADAGCGDHVTVRRQSPAADSAPPAKPPCHGPTCSAAPVPTDAPPATAPAPRPADSDDLATLPAGPTDEGVARPTAAADSGPRPVRRSTDQFRPPRPC